MAERLVAVYQRPYGPDPEAFGEALRSAAEMLAAEPTSYRPHASDGAAGGLVELDPERITVIVPDIHARMELVLRVLSHRPENAGREEQLLTLLHTGEAQLVCVGDYVHAESRAFRRWLVAYEEFAGGYRNHQAMDEEMRESLGTVEMLLELKGAVPESVHLLKGNHENITNEEGRGNLPFGKFAVEGAMVAAYMEQFYGADVVEAFDRVEHLFPLLSVGAGFLVSHAEPQAFYSREDVIEYRRNPEVVFGLTWTPNDGAEPGSVEQMLSHHLGTTEALYFGGHRPIEGAYALRAEGRYVQLHNPDAQVIAVIPPDRPIDLDRDIVVLGAGEAL
ncbi:MAG: metallophosphoesterase [Spirochaetaceae bacterium]